MATDSQIQKIIDTNALRIDAFNDGFNPITGFNSVGQRTLIRISDFAIPEQWIPVEMLNVPLISRLADLGSINKFLKVVLNVKPNETDRAKVADMFIRIRYRFDFPFWAASLVKIHNKEAGADVLFRLRFPQRILVSKFEQKRKAGLPIRLILLKARQWGGSTTTQIYMAWLQFIHKKGLNSLIIAHQGAASDEIKDMFDTMIKDYPIQLLYPPATHFSADEPKLIGVGKSGSTSRVPQRNCKIKIGTAERPDGCRGGAYSLIHLSEVGIWKKTDGKAPEDIVRSACSGVLLRPLTMIVMESTANGTGNFFHTEYSAAADPDTPSQFESLFIPWFFIEQYTLPFHDDHARRLFAASLFDNRLSDFVQSPRQESGKYLWWLWQKGASLEAINWYVAERAARNDHALMAAEYPSDDVEAFVHSGSMVFDRYLVERFYKTCRPPRLVGELEADATEGSEAITNIRFINDRQGLLAVWALPEQDNDTIITDRYIAVVDIGGRSAKADWSVILVIDRINMLDSQPPAVVAQWYGHADIDRLAWKAAQIAAFYNNALLVIESNTIETHDRNRFVEGGDQSQYILNQIADIYPNLYARRQSEDEIRQGAPRKFGFHTNIATKPMIISTLIKIVREQLYTERDRRALDEFLVYERKPNGAYGALVGRHDDLLMTRAIGLHICFHEMPLPRIIPKNSNIRKKISPASEAVF